MNNVYILVGLVVVVVGVLFTVNTTHAPEELAVSTDTEMAVVTEETTPVEEKDEAVVSPRGNTIDLRTRGLTSVPEYVFEKKGTEVLLLSGNELDGALPAEVRHLGNLQILDLSNNNFTGVPAEVGQLKKLEMLDLSGNPITGLPLEIGNLQNLKTLDLRDTQYSAQDLVIIRKSLPTGVQILVE